MYNLNFRLLDNQNKLIENGTLISNVKKNLSMPHIHMLFFNNEIYPVKINWDNIELSSIEHCFMGDMVCSTIYCNDNIVYQHTLQTMEKIEKGHNNQFKIKFQIFKYISV